MSESGLNVLLMKKMKQLSTFLIVLAILCAGCGLPDRNLKENVKEQDVVCEWSLRPESLALLARDGFKTNSTHHYRIHFQTNGACLFQTVVDDFRSGVYHDVKGTWKLEHDTTGNSNIKKKNTIQIELPLMHAAVLARRTGRRYATLVIGVSLMHLPGAGSPEDGLMRNRN